MVLHSINPFTDKISIVTDNKYKTSKTYKHKNRELEYRKKKGNPHGVVAKMPNCSLEINKFKL